MNALPDAHPAQQQPESPRTPHTDPDALARKLAYAGVLPFVACTLFIWLLASREDMAPLSFVARAMAAYAALVVAFLGGIPWGLSLAQRPAPHAEAPAPASRTRALWRGLAYTSGAWVAVLMPPHAGLVLLGGLLLACYLGDRKCYPALGAAAWLTLRFRLTGVATLSCFLAAAQL